MNVATAAGLLTLLGGALSLYANAQKSQADAEKATKAAEQARKAQEQAEEIARLARENTDIMKKLMAATTGDGSYVYFKPLLTKDTISLHGIPVGGTPIYDVMVTVTDIEAFNAYMDAALKQNKEPTDEGILAASRRTVHLGTIPTLSNAPQGVSVAIEPGIHYSMNQRDELVLRVEIWSRFGQVLEMIKITKTENPPLPDDPKTGKPNAVYSSPFGIDVIYKVERDGELLQQSGLDRLGTDADGKPSWFVRPTIAR